MDNSGVKRSILLAVLPGGAKLILEYTDSVYSKRDIAKLKGGVKHVAEENELSVLSKVPTIEEFLAR